MDLFPDFKDLLEAFASFEVECVLLGGYAVIFHGRPRATKDLDLLVSLEGDNLERVAKALTAFGAAPQVIDAVRRMTADQVVYFGVPPLRVDLLGSASGVAFRDVLARSERAVFDGVEVRVIGLDDLIVNKRASGRPRDLDDCAELEGIRAKTRS